MFAEVPQFCNVNPGIPGLYFPSFNLIYNAPLSNYKLGFSSSSHFLSCGLELIRPYRLSWGDRRGRIQLGVVIHIEIVSFSPVYMYWPPVCLCAIKHVIP